MVEKDYGDVEDKMVQVIYCRCGQSINQVIAIDECIERDPADKAATTREVNKAKSFGIKTAIMTLGEFRKIPFMCETDKCIDK